MPRLKPDDFEMDEDWFARAMPIADVMPVLAEYWRISQSRNKMPPRNPKDPDAVYSPGVLLKAELEVREMSQRKLAARMQRPASTVREIILGRKAITPRTALDLECALEIPARVWMRLETEYRLTLEQQKEYGVGRALAL